MIRRVVLGAAFVAFAAPAFADEVKTEEAAAPAVKVEAAAPTAAAATPEPVTEAAPASKIRYGGAKSGGCFSTASMPVS